jgi:Zn ribbon nucleic-acid-binding protein
MVCPKCKARIGIMKHLLMVETGAVHCIKCYICGYWVQIDHGKGMNWGRPLGEVAAAQPHAP